MTRSSRELRAADTVALLEKSRSGDRAAYDELFVRYRKFATGVARRQRAVDVDEAVAEAFRRTMSAIDNDHGPTSAFGPYLATAIRSVVIEQRRRTQHEQPAGTGDELLVSEAAMIDDVNVDPSLAAAFTSLPDRWKNVIWYSDVEGFAPREVAKMLGVRSSNAVSSLRARAQLGLRAAYLTTLADEAHTAEVREYLAALVAGSGDEAELSEAVRWHLEECDECSDLAGKIAALTGNRLPMLLAPAVLAGFGPEFGSNVALLPGRARFAIGDAASTAGSAVAPTTRWAQVAIGGTAAALVAIGFVIFQGSDDLVEPSASLVAAPSTTLSASTPPATTIATPATLPATTTTTSSTTTTTTTTSTAPPAPAEPAVTTPLPTAPVTPASTSPPATSPPATPPPATAPPVTPPPTTEARTTIAPVPTFGDVTTTTVVDTTTTVAPTTTVEPSPGALAGFWMSDNGVVTFDLRVIDLDGQPGAVVFSNPITPTEVLLATCSSPTRCDFNGVSSPAVVSISAVADGPLTVTLLDDSGNVVDTSTLD